MATGLVTCPACGTRVLPTSENLCPACRKHTFSVDSSSVSGELTTTNVASATTVARPTPDLRAVAQAHWQTVILAGCLLASILARTYLRVNQPDRWALGRELHDLLKMWVSIGAIVSVVWMSAAARRLARLIGVASWFNVFVLLKESMGYFEDRHIAVGFLGPRFKDLPPSRRNS